jgi:hypothetical protein
MQIKNTGGFHQIFFQKVVSDIDILYLFGGKIKKKKKMNK